MNFRFAPLALATAACFATPAVQAQNSVAGPISVKIVAFNDYHGNLESPGTFGPNQVGNNANSGNRPDVGGAEFMAAYVAGMRAKNPNTVVVGAGDLIGLVVRRRSV